MKKILITLSMLTFGLSLETIEGRGEWKAMEQAKEEMIAYWSQQNKQTQNDWNALVSAVYLNEITTVKGLLDQGVSANAVNNAGVSALELANNQSSNPLIKNLLLQYGASEEAAARGEAARWEKEAAATGPAYAVEEAAQTYDVKLGQR